MEINVRPYKEKDFDEVLEVTMQLWNLKMKPYTRKNIKVNSNIIRDTGSIPKKINEGIIIAEVDGHVAGVVHLDFKGKKESKKVSLSNIKLIIKYGLIRLLKVQSMGRFFEHRIDDDELHIHGVVVSDKYRGLGIGTSIFKYIEAFAKDKNFKKITLEVLNTNEKAYSLYKRLGFLEFKISKFNLKQKRYFKADTHIYMVREVK